MSAPAVLDPSYTVRQTEAERIEAWRLHCFLELRVPVELAEHLAASRVDLHEFKKLVDRGCPPVRAARILL